MTPHRAVFMTASKDESLKSSEPLIADFEGASVARPGARALRAEIMRQL